MRSIAIINQKGGVGKTTTAVHLAAGLARSGQRVLLVDLDPQSHASLHLGVQLAAGERGIYDVLLQGVPIADALRRTTENLALLPAGIDLVGAEIELGEHDRHERLLSDALATCSADFDFCLIDCPPSLGRLTVNALAAVDEVIIPLQPHFLALQGLGRLLETVTLVRRALNPRLRIAGIVLCMYEKSTRLAQEVLDDITQFLQQAHADDPWHGARVFDTPIRRTIKLAECPSFGQTIFEYSPSCHGAKDYLALAAELLNGNGASPAPEDATPMADAPPAQPATAPSRNTSSPAEPDLAPAPSTAVP